MPTAGSCLWLLALFALGSSAAYSQSPASAAAAGATQQPGHLLRRTHSGDFWTEPATLRSLGFEWRITGDDNRNATVQVSYRRKGEHAWHPALPLFRLQNESVVGGLPRDGDQHFNRYVAPNMFAGSILNLEPDTEYEARLMLTDPDGVTGTKVRTVTVRTRREPRPAAGGRVFHVYPFDFKGPRLQPAFTGLLAAYYLGSDQSDHSREMPPRVQPGDTILVHAGVYKDKPLRL